MFLPTNYLFQPITKMWINSAYAANNSIKCEQRHTSQYANILTVIFLYTNTWKYMEYAAFCAATAMRGTSSRNHVTNETNILYGMGWNGMKWNGMGETTTQCGTATPQSTLVCATLYVYMCVRICKKSCICYPTHTNIPTWGLKYATQV